MNLIFFFFVVTFSLTSAFDEKFRYSQNVSFRSFVKPSSDEKKFFDQKLDHFNVQDWTTWNQRYYENADHYSKNGPVFLWLNGQYSASSDLLEGGQFPEYAKAHNAYMFLLEHRYYGESLPTKDLSTENLRFLTVEQTLADVANFIQFVQSSSQYKSIKDAKWVVFGFDYGGSLAAWARLRYPHLIAGAVASSAPLLATADFSNFNERISELLASYKERCVTEIKSAYKQLDKLTKSEKGRKEITQKFFLCETLKNDKNDISRLFEEQTVNFDISVTYNKNPKPTKMASLSTEVVCDMMTKSHPSTKDTTSSLSRLAAVNKMVMDAYELSCVHTNYDEYVKYFKKTDPKTAMNSRRTYYQKCYELGFWKTSSKRSDTFGWHLPYKFFMQRCSDIFDEKFKSTVLEKGTKQMNRFYGDINIDVGNVIYVHGSIDPWYITGNHDVSENTPRSHRSILISGTSHYSDMYSPTEKDSKELKQAREKIKNLIKFWL